MDIQHSKLNVPFLFYVSFPYVFIIAYFKKIIKLINSKDSVYKVGETCNFTYSRKLLYKKSG